MSENNNINEFDNLFKDAFNNAEVTPPADAWSGIQSQIGSSPAPGATGTEGGSFIGGLTSIKGIIIAAAVATGVIATVMLTGDDKSDNNNTTTENTVADNTNKETITQPEDNTTNNSESNNSNEVENTIPEENSATNTPIITTTPNSGGSNTPNADNSTNSNNNETGDLGDVAASGTRADVDVDPSNIGVDNNDNNNQVYEARLHVNGSTILCSSGFIKFSVNPAKNAKEYQWDFGDGSETGSGQQVAHLYSKAGKYTVTVTVIDEEGTTYTDNRIVTVGGPSASFTAEDLGEGKFRFNNTSTDAFTFKWKFGDDSENEGAVNPEHQYYSEHTTSYDVTLIATSEEGCKDTFKSRLKNEYTINRQAPTAPNAFTPSNGQVGASFGVNDVFTVDIDGEDYYSLTIYSSDNKVVFQSNNKEKSWDGTDLSGNLCKQGTYYYILRYSYQGDDEIRQKSGSVTLIRN